MYDWILLFKTSEVYSAIITTTVIFIVLSTGFVFFIVSSKMKQGQYLKEKRMMTEEFEIQLMQSQIEVQETTLDELGKELHDNVGQLLSSTKMLLGVTQRALPDVPETLNMAEETLGSAISDLRLLTKSLDKEWLQQFDLITNLNTEINRINAGKVLSIQFSHPGRLPLDAQNQIILFRIVQEALQNAIKHAHANQIMVSIQVNPDIMHIEINDNGRGFKEGALKTGLGIRNMRHRTRLLGGTIKWESPGEGSTVIINLPVKEISYED